jgi:quinol monooxygenase YgiN
VQNALRDFVASVQKNEPRTHIYTALQQTQEPNSFLTYFIFEDETARNFHSSTEWVKRFTDIIYPENLEPVAFTEYRLIATTD